jgi:hypothetical protein
MYGNLHDIMEQISHLNNSHLVFIVKLTRVKLIICIDVRW